MNKYYHGSCTNITRSKIKYLSHCDDKTKQSAYKILDEIDKFDDRSNIYKYTADDAVDISENKISLYWYEKGVFLNISSINYVIIKIVKTDIFKNVYTLSDSSKVVDIIDSTKINNISDR